MVKKKERKEERKIRLKTKFDFSSAHRLVGYNGNCKQIHGHLWVVELEIIGSSKDLNKVGMLWDFNNRKNIKNLFDHKIILKKCKENKQIIKSMFFQFGNDGYYLMEENPTAENLCLEILNILKKQNKKLKYVVRVFENPNSSCEVESK